MDKTTLIHAENWPDFQATVDRLNKVARKLGMTEIQLVVLDTQTKRFEVGQITKLDVYYQVHIIGESPKIAGWSVVGKIEHGDSANLVKAYQEMPEHFRTSAPDCQHCHQPRARKTTIILRSDAGEYIQVGKACLKDFTGHANIERLAEWAEELHDLLTDADKLDEYEWEDRRGGQPCLVNTNAYLAWVLKAIHEFGWLSRSNAAGMQRLSTSDTAWELMVEANGQAPDDALLAEANALRTLVVEHLGTFLSHSDYEHNLLTILLCTEISPSNMGIAASGIQYGLRLQNAKREEALTRQTDTSAWVGEVGQRMAIGKVTVTAASERETEFGLQYTFKMLDEHGNRLTWFTANRWFDPGDTAEITKATIKSHNEWKGRKETIITRAKVENVQASQ